jgi:hypothetical protein
MENQLNLLQSFQFINDALEKNKPVAIGKIGGVEIKAIYIHFFKDLLKNINTSVSHKSKHTNWENVSKSNLFKNAGVFPETEESFENFISIFLKILPQMDALPLWIPTGKQTNYSVDVPFLSEFEYFLIKSVCLNGKIIDVKSIEPYYSVTPWTKHLKNKKILVVSPFVDSINFQYNKRKSLWEDERILPDFELITLEHQLCQLISQNTIYDNWVNMIEDMKNKISSIDFDIALIGTGASSLPLAVHCKNIGKQAIHLGGGLQILFGIKGNRWDNHFIGKNFYNENWIRPSKKETPKNYKDCEDGCYW